MMREDMANDLSNGKLTSEQLVPQLAALLKDFTQDWDSEFEGQMDRSTTLLADLGFESIDIIQLVVAIEEDITHKKVAFDKLLMKDGRYVDDLSIGQIADFLAAQL
jgi:acyl carrier protein